MSLQNNLKLKQLYQLLPKEVVVSATWLEEHGISRQLRYKYVKSGWLDTVGHSAYIINPECFTWQGLIVGLQEFSELPYHVGGLKALELQGFAHYLPIGDENKISLYGKKNLPAWLKNLNMDFELVLYKKPYIDTILLKDLSSHIQGYNLKVSSPEQAIFELLFLVEKDGISFEFVSEIFEGLTTLRPNIINKLLVICTSKKVKRLFAFFMEHYNHPWSGFIDLKDIEFGTGKMQIVKSGTMNKKYLITIPKDYIDGSK